MDKKEIRHLLNVVAADCDRVWDDLQEGARDLARDRLADMRADLREITRLIAEG